MNTKHPAPPPDAPARPVLPTSLPVPPFSIQVVMAGPGRGPEYPESYQVLDAYGALIGRYSRECAEYITAALNAYASAAPASGQDDPEWDGTDAAHPAWWRGNDAGYRSITRMIEGILDGTYDGSGVSAEPWESVKQRLVMLVRSKPTQSPPPPEQRDDEALALWREYLAYLDDLHRQGHGDMEDGLNLKNIIDRARRLAAAAADAGATTKGGAR